jgi:glycerophosphoryl diester phosphodiesterase
MKTIAHRGGIQREMQNSPEGVRLAARHKADFVELDVVKGIDGAFHCVHGLGRRRLLEECLAEIGNHMDLIAHLKGRYEAADLMLLADQIARHIPLPRVFFASHHARVLGQLREMVPEARLARFGLFPAIVALWRHQPWDCCMINHLVLLKWHVGELQRRGHVVFASCVWELRSREGVKRLGVDGAFVNLYR